MPNLGRLAALKTATQGSLLAPPAATDLPDCQTGRGETRAFSPWLPSKADDHNPAPTAPPPAGSLFTSVIQYVTET